MTQSQAPEQRPDREGVGAGVSITHDRNSFVDSSSPFHVDLPGASPFA